jgi:hypothetical protein
MCLPLGATNETVESPGASCNLQGIDFMHLHNQNFFVVQSKGNVFNSFLGNGAKNFSTESEPHIIGG